MKCVRLITPDYLREVPIKSPVKEGDVVTDTYDYYYEVLYTDDTKIKVVDINNPTEVTVVPLDGLQENRDAFRLWKARTSVNYDQNKTPIAAHNVKYSNTTPEDFNEKPGVKTVVLTDSMIHSIVDTISRWLYNNISQVENGEIHTIVRSWIMYDLYALSMPLSTVIDLCKSSAKTIDKSKTDSATNKARVLRAIAYKLETITVDEMLQGKDITINYPYLWDLECIVW